MNIYNHLMLLTSVTVDDTINLSKTIAEYGILICIASVFLVIVFYIMKRMVSSYTNLIDDIIPKIEEDTKAVNELKLSMNESMGAHNAHSNQSLRNLEKTTKDVSSDINQCYKVITELSSSIKSLESNYDTLLKLTIDLSSGRNQQNNFSQPMNYGVYHNIPYNNIVDAYDKKDREEST